MTTQETLRLEALQAALSLSSWGSVEVLLQNAQRIEKYLAGQDSPTINQENN